MIALVTSIRPYRMSIDGTGEYREGVSVQFLDPNPINENGFRGMEWSKVSAPVNFLPEFTTVPGFYEIDLRARAGGKIGIRSIKFISDVKITQVK